MFSHSGAYFAYAVVTGCLTASLNCTQAKYVVLDYLVVSVFFAFVYFLSTGTGQPV